MRKIDYFGTLGQACADPEILRKMFKAGMTGVRLNLSHSSLDEAAEWIDALNEASRDVCPNRKFLIDLQGPELRIGELPYELELVEGEEAYFVESKAYLEAKVIPVQSQIMAELTPGRKVLLDDGKMLVTVEAVYEDHVTARVVRGGLLSSRKSIAIPGVEIMLPTLTIKDLQNIGRAKAYGVTGVMLPFVRYRQDLVNLRNALAEVDSEEIKIYAKIENEKGVKDIDNLADACNEIVIARGDLGNAVGLIRLPAVQEELSIACKQHRRPYMVVTQMLNSMIENPVPTRAETSDIYRAIREGASSVMLTGETAVGKYPVEAIEVLVATGQVALERE